MTSMLDSDIDQFIQNQKAKLQQERQLIADDERGERVGRRQWDGPDRETQYAEQKTNDYLASQPEIDYQEWEKAFQKEKQKDYNEYLEKKKHKLRKQPTPPGSGLKFGEYEEYRKRMDRQRKQDYRQDLEKQRKEQLVLKAERDFNGIQFLQTSPRYPPAVKNKQEQKINEQIQTQKQREFDKMMALDKARDKKVPPRREEPRPRENRPVERLDLDQVPLRREETRPTQNGPVERLDRGREDRPPIPQNPKLEAQVEKISDPNNYRDTFNYERHHQQLREERQKETRKFFQEKSQPQTQRTNEQDKPETGLGLGKYQEKRKLLDEERKREYNEMLAKQARKGKKTKAAQIREEQEAQYRAPQGRDRSPRDYSPVQYNGTEYLSPRQPAQTHLDSTRRLQEEKENEYYDLVNKLQEGRDDNVERPRNRQEPPSLYTNGEKEALTMLEEKEREYQQLLRERQEREREREREPTSNRDKLPPKPPTPGGLFNKLGAHDREREKLNEERKEEYNKLLNEGDTKGRRRDPREPIEPEPRQSRPAERQSRPEQRQSRPEQRQSRPEQRGRPASEEGASLKGLNPRDSAELRKKQLRNDEYNEYLRQKSERSNRQAGRPPLPSSAKNQRDGGKKEDIYATLPGLHYNGSAEQRKKAQRNREYNEMVAQKEGRQRSRSRSDGPPDIRRGWQSPSYDDILDKKRQEEAQYRREDPNGMRAYNSEPAIDTLGNDRYKELDRDYDTRKVRFRDQRSNILDNDRWLDSDQVRRDAEYQDLQQQQPPAAPRGPPPRGDQQAPQAEMATSYFATLPVGANNRGGNERDSAKRRRQDKYREELQFQMQEALAAKRREKVEDLRVNASGFLDPEKTSHRFTNLGNPDITPRQNLRSPEVQAYHTKFDLSPRGGQGRQQVSFDEPSRGRERGRAPRRDRGGGGGGGGGGLLDGGFDGLLEGRPRQAYLPPGLEYTPSFADPSTPGRNGYQSTYITGAGGALSNPALSSIDEAYHFYAMKNPLEPDNNGTSGSFDLPLNRLDEPSYRGRGSPPRVTFDDNTRARSRSRERISPYQFPSDDDFRSKSRQDQKSYQNELERQIQEKRYREQREKEERDRYDKKLEEEIRNYNPFGRGGGGAPIKDNYGNAVTDLRSMHMDNVSGTPRDLPARESPRFRAPGDVKDDLIKPPPAQINAKGENTYARGGHGIFGQPRTDAEKDTADKYKDDLRRQIEEKKRQEQIEREKEKIEEEKENRRLEEQRLRIQQEYEEEQRKKREKEEDARRKNEELRQQAEDRKKEEERKKREVADARSREKREQEDRERAERQREERGSSPPIPALRSKMATDNGEPSKGKRSKAPPRQRGPPNAKSPKNQSRDYGYDHFRTGSVSLMSPNSNIRISPAAGPSTSEGGVKSPPVPSHRNQQTPEAGPAPQPLARANSSDVLKELATMRKQLQTERKRVENALENQRNEPDVFDPRMVQRPQPREVDVFERAKQGHAAVPQRQTDTANPKTLQEFNELKYKTDTDSRRAFRSMFPDAPTSNSALESQQDALLRHQEDTIQNLRTKDYTPSGRQGTMSPKSMLNSNSAFIDAEGINHFPEDFEDLPKRNESARMRRRERIPVSPRPESLGINPMGSTTSLDVDRIQKKNDARLRRLHQMNTDDVSIADPDDILDRFMAKQRYNRPPSGQTLQDDSWLRPGSKAF